MKKTEYHVASFSGGKDSTAMVLHMIERGDHLDEVLCCDTTMEYPAMYRHIEKVKKVVEADESIKNRAFHADLKRLLAGEISVAEIVNERKNRKDCDQ